MDLTPLPKSVKLPKLTLTKKHTNNGRMSQLQPTMQFLLYIIFLY